MWSDPNLIPYMAVMAHWLQSTSQATQHGPQHILKLWVDLVGFLHVPGRHDDEHLAHAFMYVLDRISIIPRVNASAVFRLWLGDAQCDWRLGGSPLTMHQIMTHSYVYHLEKLLEERNIPFDAVLCCIRSVHIAILLRTLIYLQVLPTYHESCMQGHTFCHNRHGSYNRGEGRLCIWRNIIRPYCNSPNPCTGSKALYYLILTLMTTYIFQSDTGFFNLPSAVFTSIKTSRAARLTATSRYGCSVVLNATNGGACTSPSNGKITWLIMNNIT